MSAPRDAFRLLFGTLTILPVKPPTSVDRRTAGRAMTLSPLAGLVLAVLVGGPLLLVGELLAEEYADPPPLVLAVLAIGALALLTRGMHLDGLADVADGLGSGRRGEAALAIMKKSDIGPFGVVTLVLVLLLQVAALATCLAAGQGPAALLVALVLSRAMLVELCRGAWPAARPDGLGAVVAGSVTGAHAVAGLALTVLCTLGGLLALQALDAGAWEAGSWEVGAAMVAALAVFSLAPALGLAAWASRRFGGVTGDVYGAVVETAFTAVLVVAALTG